MNRGASILQDRLRYIDVAQLGLWWFAA